MYGDDMSKRIVIVGDRLPLMQLFAAGAAVLALAETQSDMRAVLSKLDESLKTARLPQPDMRPVRDLRPTHQGVRAQAPLYHRARNRIG
jgi:hypothetical protein